MTTYRSTAVLDDGIHSRLRGRLLTNLERYVAPPPVVPAEATGDVLVRIADEPTEEHQGADEGWFAELRQMNQDLRAEQPAVDVETYVSRHHADTVKRVGADWSPLSPAARQAVAGTHYAERALHAGVDDRTAWFAPAEVAAAVSEAEQREDYLYRIARCDHRPEWRQSGGLCGGCGRDTFDELGDAA